MTEDEMLQGLIEAAGYGGWLVTHGRRSDLALTMGSPGFPDLVGVHDEREAIIAWELKGDRGRFRAGQLDWLAAFDSAGADVRIVVPETYDAAWRWLVGDRLITEEGIYGSRAGARGARSASVTDERPTTKGRRAGGWLRARRKR